MLLAVCSFSPDGKSILYCRKGAEEYYWKRYKGGRYQDIWLYDAAAKTHTPVTDYVDKNSYPMWIGGQMYFVSDRTGGIANLFTQKLGTKEAVQVTKYGDFDIMMPQTDGKSIVYVQDGWMHVLNASSATDAKISVTVPSDRWALRDRVINPRDYIHTAHLSDDGQTVVLEARGDIFRGLHPPYPRSSFILIHGTGYPAGCSISGSCICSRRCKSEFMKEASERGGNDGKHR